MAGYVKALFYTMVWGVAVSRVAVSASEANVRVDIGQALYHSPPDSTPTLLSTGGIHVQKRGTILHLGKRDAATSSGDASAPHSRRKRSTDFSGSDADGIVAKHNEQRGMVVPGAADMKTMVWDDDLATMAQQWSDGCLYEHGNPTNISPFTSVGQNLYIKYNLQSAGTPPNGTAATVAWYNEYVDYDFETNSCAANRVCGHYTQNVWASTQAVGCGRAYCTPARDNSGRTYNNAWLITCNYGPAGNLVGSKPYTAGPSCTKCASGQSLCYQNLCSDCSLSDANCECRADCQNCASLNSNCSCTCVDGWRGTDCGEVCENTDARCGANPGWPTFWCDRSYVIAGCPLMCGLCNAADPNFVCNSNIQNQNGVHVLIYGDINDWPSIQAGVLSSLRSSLITYCVGRQSTCCPLRNNTVVDFSSTGLTLGENYPMVTTEYSTPAYWIQVVGISPLAPGLCAQDDGGMMNPDVVLAAINGDLASLESSLNVDFGETRKSGVSRLLFSAHTIFLMLAVILLQTAWDLI